MRSPRDGVLMKGRFYNGAQVLRRMGIEVSTVLVVEVGYGHAPTLAGLFDRKTFTHSTIAAPELSMQLMRV